jgi:site-specific recombinase XerD
MPQPSTIYYAVLRERGENWNARVPMRKPGALGGARRVHGRPGRRRLRRPGRPTWRWGENLPAHHCCRKRASHRVPTRGRSMDSPEVIAHSIGRALGNPPECERVANDLTAAKLVAQFVGFTTWVQTHNPDLFPGGDPAKGIGELDLPPLEPRALSPEQVRSLKSFCDRLERFHQVKGRRRRKREDNGSVPLQAHGRPWRDRAIVYVLLATGLRREELVLLDLDQVEPHTPNALRSVRRARIARVKGKGKTERTVFLSADARLALADYLEKERPRDATPTTIALFLSASSIAVRAVDGRLSPQAINLLLTQIGHWHDADIRDPARHISPLRPHDLRHTFAFHLAKVTGADAYELERRLGHRSQRYIQRYTNSPEEVAAQYVEEF